MTVDAVEARHRSSCPLCGQLGSSRLPVTQIYEQGDAPPALLPWHSCRECGGWHAEPMPTPAVMLRHFMTRNYGQAEHTRDIAADKQELFDRVLAVFERRSPPGTLLDVGCNFGAFLEQARKRGWRCSGQEPYEPAAAAARDRGFDVRTPWNLQECGFEPGYFRALTSIDVFYYSRAPRRDLQTYFALLAPGGTLALRTSNRLWALRLARRLTRGRRRDALVSRLLLGQFHALSVPALCRILRQIGFARVVVDPHGHTRPYREMRLLSRAAYLGARALSALTLGRVNLAPGILVFAEKAG